MEATPKAPAIDRLITDLTGRCRITVVGEGTCMTCDARVAGFRDALSRKEYAISGMCQECQDAVFGGPDA